MPASVVHPQTCRQCRRGGLLSLGYRCDVAPIEPMANMLHMLPDMPEKSCPVAIKHGNGSVFFVLTTVFRICVRKNKRRQ